MAEIILLSIISYIGTNIDDMIINTLFFASVEKRSDICSIVLGKYLGIGALALLSILGSFGLSFLPAQYVACLGLVPILLGVKETIRNIRGEEETPAAGEKSGLCLLWPVVLVTVANGADNIGVYVPLFAGFTRVQYIIFVAVFACMIAAWCAAGYALSKIPLLNSKINRHKKVVVPTIYILLGIYITSRSFV